MGSNAFAFGFVFMGTMIDEVAFELGPWASARHKRRLVVSSRLRIATKGVNRHGGRESSAIIEMATSA